jgi:hypothetical protein
MDTMRYGQESPGINAVQVKILVSQFLIYKQRTDVTKNVLHDEEALEKISEMPEEKTATPHSMPFRMEDGSMVPTTVLAWFRQRYSSGFCGCYTMGFMSQMAATRGRHGSVQSQA